MPRMIIELTNRCNLRCQHCFAERHAATGDLPLAILAQVLQEGKDCGITIWRLPAASPRSTASSQRSSHAWAQRTTTGVWSAMASTFRRSTPSCCALGRGSRVSPSAWTAPAKRRMTNCVAQAPTGG